MRKLHQVGDTIVEVLMAVAIASVILTGAFVSAQHSLIGTRQSQERAEALKVAEQQLEHLRELSAVPGNKFTDTSQSGTTCITNQAVTSAPPAWQSTPPVLPVGSENFNDPPHPAACTFTPSAGVKYYPVIRRTVPATGKYTFEVIVHWPAAGGKGNQEVILYYRLYS